MTEKKVKEDSKSAKSKMQTFEVGDLAVYRALDENRLPPFQRGAGREILVDRGVAVLQIEYLLVRTQGGLQLDQVFGFGYRF